MSKTRFINPLLQRTDEPKTPAAQAPLPTEPEADATAPEAAPTNEAAATATPAPQAAVSIAVSEPAPALPFEPGPQPTPTGPEAPVKFTFYFAPEQLRRLDDLWLRAKLQYRARINKSEFVRLALDRLMEEFDQNPKQVLEDLSNHKL